MYKFLLKSTDGLLRLYQFPRMGKGILLGIDKSELACYT
nr:MAG TPA: hypothetical protein [Caudoviricetes sp.]